MINHKEVIANWKEFEIPEVFHRNHNINLNSDFIVTISGPRRAGKTFLCFQIIKELLNKGVSNENILYINFEDNKLLGAGSEDLEKLFESYLEIYEINKEQEIYLFLDEIQVVKDWDSWVRKIHDTNKKIKIILTGSSSKLLSKEISTVLRGRAINKEVFPLSFKEIVSWKGIDYDFKKVSYSKNKIEIKKAFNKFLKEGGYPAITYQKVNSEEVLQNYYESMIFKDIVERYKIEDVKKIKMLANLLLESTAKDISYNNLANKLKSLGLSMSKNTIIEYISYFEDAYLFFQNIKYEYSVGKQLGSIKKVYFIDNGLLNAVSFKFSDDKGKLMENLVFLELRRRYKKIYYNKDKHECDFLVQEKNKVVKAIQSCWEINDDNQEREIKGLVEALKKFNLKEGLLLTNNQEEEIKVNNKKIKVLPVWKWLLQEKI